MASINASTSGAGGVITTADNTGILNLQSGGTTVATVSSTGLAVTGALTSNGVSTSPFTMKNRIINGDMVIDQRNNGASTTPTVNGTYSLDRWQSVFTQASKYSVQQNAGSVTPPTGFTNYLGITSTSAYSISSGDIFNLSHNIEAYNINDFAWGTANAQTVTLSFWVRSSLTGTFGGAINNGAANRFYPFTYTISSANTWTKISITIAGDTSGTWTGTNGLGLTIRFGLGVGSTYSGTAGSWGSTAYYSATGTVSVVGTNGATFYITGVQLEVGTQATSFEWLPYGMELMLCQRYYYLHSSGTQSIGVGYNYSATLATGIVYFPVTMRAVPTLNATSGTNYYAFARNGTQDTFNSFSLGTIGVTNAYIDNSSEISGTAGQAGLMFGNNSLASVAFQAEL